MKMKKRLFSLLLAAAMTLSAIPLTANAAGTQNGQPDFTVNQSKVAFAGHEWWVIGDDTSGVYPQSDHITLLAADNDFGETVFRSKQDSAGDGYTEYIYDDIMVRYYANNPEGMEAWKTPNEYAGSVLQQKMVSIADEISDKEQKLISARSLTGGGSYQSPSTDGIAGQGVDDQKLWALSKDEWDTIGNTEVRKYDDFWWLRSPYPNMGHTIWWCGNTGDFTSYEGVQSSHAVRPAFSLNLSSVLFMSAADESGKSSAAVGDGLVGAEATTGTVKFTIKDSEQKLTVNATTAQSTQTGEALSFSYSDATTGENQYVSCILIDDSGSVKYYGKLADSSSAASGNLSVPLAGVADGIYTLKIFSEQANGDLYTDFCSEPVSMKVAVTSGKGTVSEFGGTLIHEHSWSDAWSSNDTHHWHECTVSGCPVTDNSQKDGYAEHTYNQTVEDDQYLKSAADCDSPAVYYQSCVCGAFSETAGTFTQGTAAGHSWGEPVWNWSDDGKTAAVTFTCKNDSTHTQSPEVAITSKVKTPATCTEMGTTTYTATVTFNGQQYTSTKDVVDIDIAPTAHDWGEPVWKWSDDGKTATVTFTCKNDSTHTQSPEVAITSAVKTSATCTEMGTTAYTAKATFNGQEYTSIKDVADIDIVPTAHDWGEPVWNWSDDGKTVAVTFTCQNDNAHTQSPDVTITSGVKAPATCTEKGTTTYTAKATFNGQDYTSTKDVVDIAKLNHTLKKTDKVEATCTTAGKEAYYTCESCSKHFSDAEGNNEITKLEEYGIIPATEHKAGTEWKHNATGHWNECMNNCGEKLNEAVHTFEWVVDKEATAAEAGSKHEECTVCGYEKAAVEIPATGTTDPTDPPKPTDPDKENPGEGTDIPQTGDNSHPLMWIMLASLSGGAVLTLTLKGKRKTNQ